MVRPCKVFAFLSYLILTACAGHAPTPQPSAARASESPPHPAVGHVFAATLAAELAAACPPADPGDESAREACAEKVAVLPSLRSTMAEPFLWGGQKAPGVYALDESHLTKFAPFAWRKMYLSTFMFDGTHRVEEVGGRTVVHIACTFRNELDAGAYPYPFWHSEKKWRAYEVATELLFVVENGRVLGAMRTAEADTRRAAVPRSWDGAWTWAGGAEPRNTLFRNLFSATNPHVDAVDRAYRDLEQAMRPHNCTSCHVPNNPSGMNPLELLVYPNQALAARVAIIRELEKNTMPPETASTPAGIADPAARQKLLELAREFARAADRALAAEGERVGSTN